MHRLRGGMQADVGAGIVAFYIAFCLQNHIGALSLHMLVAVGQQGRKNAPYFLYKDLLVFYRLVHEGKPLPDWHPLISGRKESVGEAGILIQNGIHEHEVDECDWDDWYKI